MLNNEDKYKLKLPEIGLDFTVTGLLQAMGHLTEKESFSCLQITGLTQYSVQICNLKIYNNVCYLHLKCKPNRPWYFLLCVSQFYLKWIPIVPCTAESDKVRFSKSTSLPAQRVQRTPRVKLSFNADRHSFTQVSLHLQKIWPHLCKSNKPCLNIRIVVEFLAAVGIRTQLPEYLGTGRYNQCMMTSQVLFSYTYCLSQKENFKTNWFIRLIIYNLIAQGFASQHRFIS